MNLAIEKKGGKDPEVNSVHIYVFYLDNISQPLTYEDTWLQRRH